MGVIDLHGAEVVFATPAVPVSIGGASVVGVVASAPDAAGATSARLALGAGAAALLFTAAAGAAGNRATIALRGGGANKALAVSVSGTAATAQLATDADGEITTTAAQLKTAWDAHAAAMALATLTLPAGSGAGTLATAAASPLAGGTDDPWPLNTPVAVRTSSQLSTLGSTGLLKAAIEDVWRTSGAPVAAVVAVRSADDTDAGMAGTRAARSGVYALLDAFARTGLKPRLITVGGTAGAAARLALEAVAAELRALPIVGLDGAAGADAAIAARADFGRTLVAWPRLIVVDPVTGRELVRPAGPLVAGHAARNDRLHGFADSPSNRAMLGVLRTEKDVDWQIDSRSSTANQLSRANIVTAIRRPGGVHLWGNRLADGQLIPARRVQDLVADALLVWIADYIDRRLDEPFVALVLRKINQFLDTQVLAGVLSGGRAWFDPALNTAATLEANKVTFSFELGLYSVAEHIVFRQTISGVYSERVLQSISQAA